MPYVPFKPAKNLSLLRFSIARNPAEYLYVACMALGHEDIAVGRGQDLARLIKPGGEQSDFESGRCLWPGIVRPINHARPINCRIGGVGCREIFRCDLMHCARLLRAEVRERRFRRWCRLRSRWKNIVDRTNTTNMAANAPAPIARRSKALRWTFGLTD